MEAILQYFILIPLISSALTFLCRPKKLVLALNILLIIATLIIACKYSFESLIEGKNFDITLFTWFDFTSFVANWSLMIDPLSACMLALVTIVSVLVHIYSLEYMAHDDGIIRFMSYLSLFTFFMLSLVTSDNLIQLFFGWEGVGLCSYLLIGFWYQKESANKAAMKAFLVNRVADIAFVLGIGLIYYLTGSIEFKNIFSQLSKIENHNMLEIAALLLFIGAMGKSAQLGLHIWLPDAMEGPTPVSALIHAATMVTAGVFLVARFSYLYELTNFTSQFIIFIGSATALFAGLIACTQNDIKKIIELNYQR